MNVGRSPGRYSVASPTRIPSSPSTIPAGPPRPASPSRLSPSAERSGVESRVRRDRRLALPRRQISPCFASGFTLYPHPSSLFFPFPRPITPSVRFRFRGEDAVNTLESTLSDIAARLRQGRYPNEQSISKASSSVSCKNSAGTSTIPPPSGRIPDRGRPRGQVFFEIGGLEVV